MKINKTTINHPIIKAYSLAFADNNEISKELQQDEHNIFEKYINNLVLMNYGDDLNADYNDMEVKTAFGVDGIAIFIDGKMVVNESDINDALDGKRKVDVSFLFVQTKTTAKFERSNITDFFSGVRRFFDTEQCDIYELREFWSLKNFLYTKATKFKKTPDIKMIYVSLSPTDVDLTDTHLSSTITLGKQDILNLNLISNIEINFLGIKEIMSIHEKMESEIEKTIKLKKQLVPFPKDNNNIIQSGYYGLIELEEYIKLLIDEDSKTIKKGIFNDNIRDYLGANDKVEVNTNMKNQLIGDQSYLFGLLNNGITIIADEITIVSDEACLRNYQIVNGCQTSNVILETLNDIKDIKDIYIPIKLISTEDDDTKNSIIKATNSQTELKTEQLLALLPIQKAIEKYYETKSEKIDLYYERRTAQYRNSEVLKSKIINIPTQIKSIAAFFFDIPHEVSGQYGKAEKQTRDKIFKDTDISLLSCYYVSGLSWYRIERFVNSISGKKYKRARWHILMLFKYLLNDITDSETKEISKRTATYVTQLENIMFDDKKSSVLISKAVSVIDSCLVDISDRKTFEKQSTTAQLIKYLKDNNIKYTKK